MFCKNCGARLDDSTVFCTQCGIRLVKSPVPPAQGGSGESAEDVKAPIAEEISASAAEAVTEAAEPSENIPVMGTIPTSGVGGDPNAPRGAEAPANAETAPNAGTIPRAQTPSGAGAFPNTANYGLPPAPPPVKEKTFFGVGALVFCLIIIGVLSIATGVFAGLYFSAIA